MKFDPLLEYMACYELRKIFDIFMFDLLICSLLKLDFIDL